MPDAAASLAAPSVAAPPPGRVLFRVGPVAITPRRLFTGLLALAAVIALAMFWGRLDIADLHARARALPAIAVIAVVSLLPLAGFPVSWLHLIAGVRFGFAGGIAVVAFAGLVHHTLGWTLVRVLPRRYFSRLAPWREKLAGAGHREAAVLCCLLPGMPYTVTLYLLPVLGAPLGLLLGLNVPLHTTRAIVTILLGDMGASLTVGRVAALAAYYAVLFSVCTFSLRRLRRTLARKKAAQETPLPPGRIAGRARRLWELAGSPSGRDPEFWTRAEAELKQEDAETPAPKDSTNR